ncbi:2-dehydro-3-deoxy-D-gluconate 5-dehydrogenase KduD [Gracilibacillus sp. S3-1-1]|uniref:2-dehydro-3-deoxy-D-gluconate 5-dehydrogenase KduD n=1 Tax=Gracilibacillus pellucidus TaxID=3095368 RepID=A0ACC6M2I0_9BACI|nr:2-dehydro-3-deoxy-D-gluconate 5-dehydrogenase KduD [Gracilibacillus sp. S3-1-1]MDX8045165.1 2-dehydro-3-deoxy-D-gluconate 5-dehydrogenase KduD [Gracilibacillus sp. S3-1-1]
MGTGLQDFSLDYFSLKGKTAIVTGGNTGLGQAYTVALAKAGANVFVVTHGTDWEDTKEQLADIENEVAFFQADLINREQLQQVVPACVEEFGTVDILVNNAGTIRRNPLLEFNDEDWDDVIGLNLDAVYFLSQRAAKVMVEKGSGKIINIASMLSFQGGKFIPPYTASKHAVAGLTKSFANELAEHGIQVNAIAPGYFATKNTAPIRADEKRNAEILSRIPAGYWADPSDLMGTVVYLASTASDYMNGHILAVDGGWLAR